MGKKAVSAGAFLLLSVFSCFLFGGAVLEAAPVRLRSIWSNGRRNVNLLDAAAGFGASVSRSASQIVLTQGKNRLVFQPDKRYAYFNNVRVNLCFPLLRQGQTGRIGFPDLLHQGPDLFIEIHRLIGRILAGLAGC